VGAQGRGARSLLHISQAGYISATNWFLLHSTLGTTVHFNGLNGTACTRPLSVGYKNDVGGRDYIDSCDNVDGSDNVDYGDNS
jgi:hypothetical protein